jgi:hypothetical protein
MGEWWCNSTILVLGTEWRWVASFTPLPLYGRETVPRNHGTRDWVVPRTHLDVTEKRQIIFLPGIKPSSSVRSSSLYWLSYLGCFEVEIHKTKQLKSGIRTDLCVIHTRRQETDESRRLDTPKDAVSRLWLCHLFRRNLTTCVSSAFLRSDNTVSRYAILPLSPEIILPHDNSSQICEKLNS